MEQADRLAFQKPDTMDGCNSQAAPGMGSELRALAVAGASLFDREKRHRQPLPLSVEILRQSGSRSEAIGARLADDENAGPLPRLQNALVPQFLQSPPDSMAVDTKSLGKLGLGRQAATTPVFASRDGV